MYCSKLSIKDIHRPRNLNIIAHLSFPEPMFRNHVAKYLSTPNMDVRCPGKLYRQTRAIVMDDKQRKKSTATKAGDVVDLKTPLISWRLSSTWGARGISRRFVKS